MLHDARLSFVILVALLFASAIGMALHRLLDERHKTSQTVDHVRLVVSILVTFTALVLGLLLSEVKGSYDRFDTRMRAFAGDISNLDIHLREYGDEAKPIRAKLREYVAAAIADSWRNEPPPSGAYPRFPPTSSVERQQLGAILIDADVAIHRLEPQDGFHQRLAAAIAVHMDEVLQARRQLIETAHDTITWPLLLAMCGWLAVVFGVFGLIAPRNVVVYCTIIICAICVASAIFFIIELDSPLNGLLHVSSDPLRDALANMDEPR